jgi:hypothetical protein
MTIPTKEKLTSLYFDQRQSTNVIARTFGVSGYIARKWMKAHGIPWLPNGEFNKGRKPVNPLTPEQRKMGVEAIRGKPSHNFGKGRVMFICEVCGAKVFDKPNRRKRTCSLICRDKLGIINRGRKHWNYKGEKAGFRQKTRVWSEYREWRNKVFARDKYTCRACEATGGKLTAHHLYTWHNHPDYRFKLGNGVCLCKDCHWTFHRATSHHHTTPRIFYDWLNRYSVLHA